MYLDTPPIVINATPRFVLPAGGEHALRSPRTRPRRIASLPGSAGAAVRRPLGCVFGASARRRSRTARNTSHTAAFYSSVIGDRAATAATMMSSVERQVVDVEDVGR